MLVTVSDCTSSVVDLHVDVSGLGKETERDISIQDCLNAEHAPLALHQQTQLPSGSSLLASRLVDNDSVQETTTSDELDERAVDLANAFTEDLTQALGAFRELLALKDVEGSQGHGAAKRVTAICASVLSGLDGKHDFLARKHTGDRVDYHS